MIHLLLIIIYISFISLGLPDAILGAAFLPYNDIISIIGFVLIGLGCAPIYPCIIHSTPKHFGADKSQAIIGVQMAVAYIGTCLMPPLFGLIANHISIALLPLYLVVILIIMIIMHESMLKTLKNKTWFQSPYRQNGAYYE